MRRKESNQTNKTNILMHYPDEFSDKKNCYILGLKNIQIVIN